MGIPQLTRHLRPYAESRSLYNQEIVIDGPAFCHHIYYVCLNSRRKAKGPLETAISYNELGLVAIAWLDALRASSVTIRKIYFDGFLPPSKYDVRIRRLVGYTQQVVSYHGTYHTVPGRIPCPAEESGLHDLFPRRGLSSDRLKSLPSPPFLVPSILEVLAASDSFKGITEVIPGEADLYCAQSLKGRAGIVLTGDSDLLVHDLGPGGAVSFFTDIEPVPKNASGDLQSMIYHTATIADRLLLPKSEGLRALAFELYKSPGKGFGEVLADARVSKAIGSEPDLYKIFQKEYVSLLAPANLTPGSDMIHILKVLDPRISEYVLQFPFIAEITGQPPEYNTSDPATHVFLPFLIDCPLRTNAWEMSRAIRQLAYGLVNIIAPEGQRKSSVFEHTRQQGIHGGRELELPDTSHMGHIIEACSGIVAILEQLAAKFPCSSSSEVDLWLAVAVYHDIEWTHMNSKPALIQSISRQLQLLEDESNPEKNLTWEILQFLAQIQGSYHSFRILKQIVNLLASSEFVNSLPPPILQLRKILQLLPPISTMQDMSQTIVTLQKITSTTMSTTAHEILGIVPPNQPVHPGSLQAKKSRKRDRNEECVRRPPKKSNNPFELLELE